MKNSVHRRNFLQNSAIATAGLALHGLGLLSCGPAKSNNSSDNTSTGKKKRKIGSSEVSHIGLGCMSMAGIYNAPMPKGEMVKLIHKAVEMGVDFFDTAEVYGPFYSEEIVGEALKPFRNKVNIIRGNSHMPMMDTNNQQIADLFLEWLAASKK